MRRLTLAEVRWWSELSRCEIARRTGIAEEQIFNIEQQSERYAECTARRVAPGKGPMLENLRRLADVLGEGVWASFGYEPVGVARRKLQEVQGC